MRTTTLIVLSVLVLQPVYADEIRHLTFPNALLGTWAETAEQCAAKDESNILIDSTKYSDGSGSCTVRWIVETAASRGTNYAVHALCASASQPPKTQTVNIIVRPVGEGRAVMGRSFADLKNYLRCP